MTRMPGWTSITLGLVLGPLLGCSGGDQDPFQLPAINFAQMVLPKTPDGNFVAIEIANAALEISPFLRDPLTGLGACTDLITYCYAGGTSLDDCIRDVPRCRTSKPWEEPDCCPGACVDAYGDARRTTPDAAGAFEATFFAGGTPCYPGVKASLEGR